jgi:single stranded DNA-binding protein
MNKVELVGRLTRDPQLVERSGKDVCDMRLAVNDGGKTTYIDLVAFGEQAASSAAEFEKGSRVEAKGSLRYSEWEVKPKGRAKAQKRSKHSVIVRELAAA